MNHWAEAPFIRILLPFLAGILLAINASIYFENFFIYPLAIFLFYFLINLVKQFQTSYSLRWLNGLLLNLLFFLLGIQFTFNNTDKFIKNHFSRFIKNDSSFAIIQLLDPTVEKTKSYKVIAQVKKIIAQNKIINCDGKLMVYLKKDQNSPLLRYGDLLLVKTKFKTISPPQNPNEFDYRKYLSYHNIYQQAYLTSEDWKPLNENEGNFIFKVSYQWREFFFHILYKHLPTTRELAVGSALILGYMDYIDDQIIQAYSSTGAMHVLSVSGLHVGIIFLVLKILLTFLDRNKWTKILKTIFIVLFIWAFTLVSGSATATVRAAIMLSLIVIGMAYFRTVNIYNIIACSAFFMLCYNPYFIMDVGFQLSYLAMLGLVSLQPKIYNLIYVQNRLGDKIWALIAVSFAAQIATFPLGFLYFHQFPNYFLLSNLIVVPSAALILYAGIALLIFSPIELIAYWIGKILYWLVFFLNWCMFYIEKMPFALMQGISISIIETWLIYFLIALALAFLIIKKPKYLIASLSFALLLSANIIYEKYEQMQQRKIIVYNIPKTSAIELVDGQNNFFLSDTLLANDESKMLFRIKHNWWENGINQTHLSSFMNFDLKNFQNHSIFFIDKNHFQFYDKRMAVVDNDFVNGLKKNELLHKTEN